MSRRHVCAIKARAVAAAIYKGDGITRPPDRMRLPLQVYHSDAVIDEVIMEVDIAWGERCAATIEYISVHALHDTTAAAVDVTATPSGLAPEQAFAAISLRSSTGHNLPDFWQAFVKTRQNKSLNVIFQGIVLR